MDRRKLPMTEEHKRKIGDAQRGIPCPARGIPQRGISRPQMRGEKNPMNFPGVRDKHRKSLMGKKRSPEQIEKYRQINLGKKASIETRKKRSQTIKAKVAKGEWHTWKGGVTKLHRSERDFIELTLEYRLWHQAVLERDDFTCQNKECGKRGGELHVDHIKPFALFPELRVAIDNGRTLCASCHRKTPTYGLKKPQDSITNPSS